MALIFQCTGLLPVTIIDFKGVRNNNEVNLNCTTAGEVNLKNYQIERSTDGFNFLKIGGMAAQNATHYSFTDSKLPNATKIFYRLKLLDIDGKFKYSKTVSVRLNNNYSNAVVYPNTGTGTFTILSPKPLKDNSKLAISDITGRIIAEQNVNATQNNISADFSYLPAGWYFVTIKNKDEIIRESF